MTAALWSDFDDNEIGRRVDAPVLSIPGDLPSGDPANVRTALLVKQSWSGLIKTPVEVIGETAKRYRVRLIERTKLAGRQRWGDRGAVVLVPKTAIQFLEEPK